MRYFRRPFGQKSLCVQLVWVDLRSCKFSLYSKYCRSLRKLTNTGDIIKIPLNLSRRRLLRHNCHVAWPTLKVNSQMMRQSLTVMVDKHFLLHSIQQHYQPKPFIHCIHFTARPNDTIYWWFCSDTLVLNREWYPWLSCPVDKKMMPWGITSENPWRHHAGLCLGMPQGIMRSEWVK